MALRDKKGCRAQTPDEVERVYRLTGSIGFVGLAGYMGLRVSGVGPAWGVRRQPRTPHVCAPGRSGTHSVVRETALTPKS